MIPQTGNYLYLTTFNELISMVAQKIFSEEGGGALIRGAALIRGNTVKRKYF